MDRGGRALPPPIRQAIGPTHFGPVSGTMSSTSPIIPYYRDGLSGKGSVQKAAAVCNIPLSDDGRKWIVQANVANTNGTNTLSSYLQQLLTFQNFPPLNFPGGDDEERAGIRLPERLWPYLVGSHLTFLGIGYAETPGHCRPIRSSLHEVRSATQFLTAVHSKDDQLDQGLLGAGTKSVAPYYQKLYLLGPSKLAIDDLFTNRTASANTGDLPTARFVPLQLDSFKDDLNRFARFLFQRTDLIDNPEANWMGYVMQADENRIHRQNQWILFFFLASRTHAQLRQQIDHAIAGRQPANVCREFTKLLTSLVKARVPPLTRVGFSYGYAYPQSIDGNIYPYANLLHDGSRPAIMQTGLPNEAVDVKFDSSSRTLLSMTQKDSGKLVQHGTLLAFAFCVDGQLVPGRYALGFMDVDELLRLQPFWPLLDLVDSWMLALYNNNEGQYRVQHPEKFKKGKMFRIADYSAMQRFLLRHALFNSAHCVGVVSQDALYAATTCVSIVAMGYTGVSVPSVFEHGKAPINTRMVVRQPFTKREHDLAVAWAKKMTGILKNPLAKEDFGSDRFIIPVLTSFTEPQNVVNDLAQNQLSPPLTNLHGAYDTPAGRARIAEMFENMYLGFRAACLFPPFANNDNQIRGLDLGFQHAWENLADNDDESAYLKVFHKHLHADALSPYIHVNFVLVYHCHNKEATQASPFACVLG